MLKIATWNVNSLKVRLPHVLQWLASHQPDVLALQETKLIDPDFPVNEIQQAGYHVWFSGQKTYNGVAILSRTTSVDKTIEITERNQASSNNVITDIPGLIDPQRRILGVTVGDVRILNLYVPNGESVGSEKFKYKLNWLHNMRTFLEDELQKYPKMVVLGDFNVAPAPEDVYNPTFLDGQVLFSEQERSALKELFDLGLKDCFRLHPQPEKSFSWWDYRLNAFKRNMGLRIDHILVSQTLASQCAQCYVDKEPRGWERPSDHAPVVAEFMV